MPFNILLLPLLGGFVFISYWNRSYWHAQRAEKERLLLYASCAGIVFIAIALLIASIPPFIPCISRLPCLPTWWHDHVPFRYSGVSTIALTIGVMLWWPLNRWLPRWWPFNKWFLDARGEFARLIQDEGGPLEKQLYESMVEGKWIMLTLKNGKVYIGGVGQGFTPGKDKTVFLLPLKSGYRDSQHRVNVIVDYADVFEKIKQDNPNTYTEIIGDFGVVVPVDEVIAASLYRPEVHERYFKPQPSVCPHCLPMGMTSGPLKIPPAIDVVD